MKTIVSHKNSSLKATLDLSGKFTINLPGGQTHQGEFTPAELEQIAYRFMQASKGDLVVDPAPIDIMVQHGKDVSTLEKQAVALNELRESLEKYKASDSEKEERIHAFSRDLIDARTQLRDARIEVSELNMKLTKYEGSFTITLDPKEEPAKQEELFIMNNPSEEEPVQAEAS